MLNAEGFWEAGATLEAIYNELAPLTVDGVLFIQLRRIRNGSFRFTIKWTSPSDPRFFSVVTASTLREAYLRAAALLGAV
ncbi:MAG: hypothetical protein CUN56_08875 [Phototrophicales bacterium]|nr:MAG: hypothetical protein CUN56_08875 [Phototrophicales bacterium]